MIPSRPIQLAILFGLALLMFATRFGHFFEVPDASWAIFFIGGFYLRGLSRWAFPLLMVEAVVIDGVATSFFGVSSFCLTTSYWFLIPTHAVMWLGGSWLCQHSQEQLRDLPKFALCVLASVSIAYLVSNGGFYWFGGRYSEPNLAQYLDRVSAYYRYFLLVPCAYIAAAAVVHVGILKALRARSAPPLSRS